MSSEMAYIRGVLKAVIELYGDWDTVPEVSKVYFEDAFNSGDYERVFQEIRESEKESKELLLEFDKSYPGVLKGENIDAVLEQARRKLKKGD